MKQSKTLISKFVQFLIVLSLAQAAYSSGAPQKDWKQYIPLTGQHVQADVMEFKTSQEFEKLAAKFQEALKKNPEWTTQFLKSVPKGQPLPYHENLGLTKQEHARMLELAQKQGETYLEKSGTIHIEFQPLSDGRIKLVTKEDSALNNVIISADKVDTSWGDLSDVTPINNQDQKAVTGPWKGIKWGRNTLNQETMTGHLIQFCIGKCENKDQGIIYYDGKILKGSTTPPTEFSHILFFPLPKMR